MTNFLQLLEEDGGLYTSAEQEQERAEEKSNFDESGEYAGGVEAVSNTHPKTGVKESKAISNPIYEFGVRQLPARPPPQLVRMFSTSSVKAGSVEHAFEEAHDAEDRDSDADSEFEEIDEDAPREESSNESTESGSEAHREALGQAYLRFFTPEKLDEVPVDALCALIREMARSVRRRGEPLT